MLEFNELIRKILKYIIEGLVLALVAFSIPKKRLDLEEIVILGLTASATFSLLDVFLPSTYGSSARNAAGMGVGFNLVGFPKFG